MPVIQQESYYFTWVIITAILTLFIYYVYIRMMTVRRLQVVRGRHTNDIHQSKIIVACQLQDVFVEISHRQKQNFIQIEQEYTGISQVIGKIKKMMGIGVYIKLKESKRDIGQFIDKLKENSKIQLFLYTNLPLEIANKILRRLDLARHFPEQYRRSSNDGFSQTKKHPTEVDFNTKRVIIVTGSKNDHNEQDQNYFLVVKRKQLKQAAQILNQLINKNDNVDQLHSQLAFLKAQIESDYERSHQE